MREEPFLYDFYMILKATYVILLFFKLFSSNNRMSFPQNKNLYEVFSFPCVVVCVKSNKESKTIYFCTAFFQHSQILSPQQIVFDFSMAYLIAAPICFFFR